MMETNVCLGCMEPATGAAACPHCGYVVGEKPKSALYLLPGTVLKEQYLVGRVLGHGGFGITYLGLDLNLNRKIAIKEYFPGGVAMRSIGDSIVFPHSTTLSQEYSYGLDRYLDEARLVASFDNHPNIVWVKNYFPANGTGYMVMEYLDGITFEGFLHRYQGKVSWDVAMRVMVPVMDALREVHKVGILHRDISPDNICLLRTGMVKVIDFGAARQALGRASKNLSIILKPGFAPPEQYQSKGNQGPWTDIYAVSGTIYRAITGEIPPPAPDRQMHDELIAPSAMGVEIAHDKEQALLAGLALSPEDRFQDMGTFLGTLMGTVPWSPPGMRTKPMPVPVPPPPPAPVPPDPAPVPPPKPGGLPKWLLATAGFIAVFAAGIAGMWSLTKPAVIQSFQAKSTSIRAGETTELSWVVENVDGVTIEGVPGAWGPSGKAMVHPEKNTTYTLVAKAKRGEEQRKSIEIVVAPHKSAVIARFAASETTVKRNQPFRLSWSVSDAREVLLDGQAVPPEGSIEKSIDASVAFRLTARGEDGSVRESAVAVTVEDVRQVIVTPPKVATDKVEVVAFFFDPPAIQLGQTSVLKWNVRGARTVQIEGLGNVQPQGTYSVRPQKSILAKLSAQGAGGTSATGTATLSVGAPQTPPSPSPVAPRVLSFQAVPPVAMPGQPVTLTWSVQGASNVEITPDVGRAEPMGRITVNPRANTRYFLRAVNAQGMSASAETSVTLRSEGPPQPQPQPASVSFQVIHDHDGPVNMAATQRPWSYCNGVLAVVGNRLRFQSQATYDNFETDFAGIDEIKRNRLGIRGYSAFHVKLKRGANYNFVMQRGNTDQVVNALLQATSK